MTEIENALNNNTEMTEEEYAAMTEAADTATEKHGDAEHKKYAGKPVSEATRHKRIQSNFYGSAVNILLNIIVELREINAKLDLLTKGEDDAE